MANDKQKFTLENPKVRKADVDQIDETVKGVDSPAYGRERLGLDRESTVQESRVNTDEQVDAFHPAAVIVPPEGRGVHPTLGAAGPTPEELFKSGDADEAVGYEDGKRVTTSEAAKSEK